MCSHRETTGQYNHQKGIFSPSGQRTPRPKAKYVNYDNDCTDQQLATHFRKQAGTAPLRKSHTPARMQACVTVAQGGAEEQLDHAQKDAKMSPAREHDASLTWQQQAPHRKASLTPKWKRTAPSRQGGWLFCQTLAAQHLYTRNYQQPVHSVTFVVRTRKCPHHAGY